MITITKNDGLQKRGSLLARGLQSCHRTSDHFPGHAELVIVVLDR
jgi:hypothetical protein